MTATETLPFGSKRLIAIKVDAVSKSLFEGSKVRQADTIKATMELAHPNR